MRTVTRWGPLLLAACVLASAGRAGAADEKPAGATDRKAMDTALYNNLRDVINRGAALYNSGDQAGCYRLYEGALLAVRPLLGDRKKLQDAISRGLTEAEGDPMLNRRAFVLRAVLDKVRDEVNPRGKATTGTGTGARTAWARMGGERGVTRIVDDLAAAVTKDPKVDFFRGGKYKPTDEEIAKMKRNVVAQISEGTGGPLRYTGPSMVEVHKDMGITNAQFDAFVKDFRDVLRKNNVEARDADDLIGKIEATRPQIVRPKKPGAGTDGKKGPAAGGGRVTGHVTYKGKPIAGEVLLTDAAGKTTRGTLNADGTYEVKGLKPGAYKMAVRTDDKAAKLPAKYADAATSGLTLEVIGGNQTHNIELQ